MKGSRAAAMVKRPSLPSWKMTGPATPQFHLRSASPCTWKSSSQLNASAPPHRRTFLRRAFASKPHNHHRTTVILSARGRPGAAVGDAARSGGSTRRRGGAEDEGENQADLISDLLQAEHQQERGGRRSRQRQPAAVAGAPTVETTAAADAVPLANQSEALRSVVRLEVAAAEPDWSLPWQKGDPYYTSGSACVIESPPGAFAHSLSLRLGSDELVDECS